MNAPILSNPKTKCPKASAQDLRIGGFVPFSSCDWPEHLVATLFLQGCPWRCDYCHNRHLLPVGGGTLLAWESIFAILEKRRKLLDGVVFSGGEPTVQKAILPAIKSVQQCGFKIGLHTAGISPKQLERILPYLDWVGLDIKATTPNYPLITRAEKSGEKAYESLRLIQQSGVDYEIRTTIDPYWLEQMALDDFILSLEQQGVKKHAIQIARSPLDPAQSSFLPINQQMLSAKIKQRYPSILLRQ